MFTVDDYEAVARDRLTPMAYGYFRAGADEEHTLGRNRDAYQRYELWYRTLVDVGAPHMRTRLLGEEIASPLLVAPTAYHRLAHPEGELATARAAAELGTIYCVSTLATTSLEDVAKAAPRGVRWFQLYVHKDRDFTWSLIDRAKASGYRALVVTVDTPVLGRRLADVRYGFGLPDDCSMANLLDAIPPELRTGPGSELARFVSSRHDASFTWKDLPAIVDRAAPLPVILKGIVRGDDAVRALDHGARAVWVSNHGGRQLDLAPATIDALPEVAAAVGGRCEVIHDGGVRNGTQALVALALGARAVAIGRPVLWGLATGGQAGVESVLTVLHDELVRAMQLAGAPDVSALPSDLVRRR
jgi:4-hydroxymandelate oxidase